MRDFLGAALRTQLVHKENCPEDFLSIVHLRNMYYNCRAHAAASEFITKITIIFMKLYENPEIYDKAFSWRDFRKEADWRLF